MIHPNYSRRKLLKQAGAAVTALLPTMSAARAACQPPLPGPAEENADRRARETWWVSADPHVGYPEYQSHVTELGRNQDRWFKDVLDDAPDVPTIIMTHHCPLTGRRSVSAFEEWLADDIERYNIVLWIVGHAHRWAIDEDLEGFGFDRIKVASLCRKHGDRRPCESALLTIDAGQDRARITMRFRNHLRREWISVLGREAYELEVDA